MKRPVRSRMQDVVGAEGETPLATRLTASSTIYTLNNTPNKFF